MLFSNFVSYFNSRMCGFASKDVLLNCCFFYENEKTAKGVSKPIIKNELKHSTYKDWLTDPNVTTPLLSFVVITTNRIVIKSIKPLYRVSVINVCQIMRC